MTSKDIIHLLYKIWGYQNSRSYRPPANESHDGIYKERCSSVTAKPKKERRKSTKGISSKLNVTETIFKAITCLRKGRKSRLVRHNSAVTINVLLPGDKPDNLDFKFSPKKKRRSASVF